MIGVTIIIGITISLYGNYISIIIMPTLIADASLLQFHLTLHLMLPHFYSDSGIRHRIIQGSGFGVGWELVLSQHDAKLSEQLKVFCLCFSPNFTPRFRSTQIKLFRHEIKVDVLCIQQSLSYAVAFHGYVGLSGLGLGFGKRVWDRLKSYELQSGIGIGIVLV